MCIFCGGFCAVDMALPSVAAGASLVVLKIKAQRALKNSSSDAEEEKPDDESDGGEG